MEQLTERQTEVLDAIVRRQSVLGFPPTLRELAEALGVTSTNAVSDHLDALERKGCIERQRGASRGIRVVHDPATHFPVEIVVRERGVVVSVSRGADRREALLRLLDGELCRAALDETRRARDAATSSGTKCCPFCGGDDLGYILKSLDNLAECGGLSPAGEAEVRATMRHIESWAATPVPWEDA